MEITQFWKKAQDFWKKYKYVIIILLFGLFLMLLPDFSSNENESTLQAKATQQPEESVEEKLTAILSQIEGAGEVRVMLSYARGEETVYQTDADNSSGENNSSTRVESVIISGEDRKETGLVRQVNPAAYQGAVVVCKGGDDPRVRLAIEEAVSDITGLGSDKISVLKMK